MFGYVCINRQELKVKDYETYRSYYCGLCHDLHRRYGRIGQMLLNYDMTFLAVLLTGLYEPGQVKNRRRCVTHPFQRHELIHNGFTEYAADMTVLLSYQKAVDDWRDERSRPRRALAASLRSDYQKLKIKYPRQARTLDECVDLLARAERQNSRDLDYVAGLSGKVYLRELENEGYIVDEQLKSVYVKPGETTEITWENRAITGQIQIIKKSADDNPINGLPAGTLLEGAVFEIYDKAGNVVDTIKSDSRGRAVSKQLPLSRYTIREVASPDYYAINPTVMTAYLEYEGQIVTFEVEDESVATGVNIKKTGPVQVVPGQPIQYSISGIGNTSTVQLQSFYWRDTLPGQVTLTRIVTGTYNQQLSYKIVYKTNLSGDTYRTLADNLSTTKNYVLDASPTALGLAANEKVTEFMVVFGVVKAGFAQVETPYINGTVSKGLANGSSFVNVADIGGLYNGQWIMGVSRWVTSVYAKTTVTLPRTGY